MAEITMTEAQLGDLAGKISVLAESLSDEEQTLLFALLAEGVRVFGGEDVDGFAHFDTDPLVLRKGTGVIQFNVPAGRVLGNPVDDRPVRRLFGSLLTGF